MFNTPILFLIFNRPDVTEQVFAEIRKQKPKYLYVAADGARADKANEAEKCEETRHLVLNNIDWDCEVKTLFRDENLGCGLAVSGAITWFFDNVEQGIILEDDCLPNESFFGFCEELLEKYKNNDKIFMISGDNFQDGIKRGNADYYFSIYTHIWGWATWRKSWIKYDLLLNNFNKEDFRKKISALLKDKNFIEYWLDIFQNCKENKIDTWDYQLTYAMWDNEAFCILPQANLVSNIGFRDDATHTKEVSAFSNIPTKDITIKKHPNIIRNNYKADCYTLTKTINGTMNKKISLKNVLSKFIPERLKHIYRLKKYPHYQLLFEKQKEIKRIQNIVRFMKGSTNLLGQELQFVDSASFLFIYDELFNKEIYKFKSDNTNPYIIDAGANIGLGIIYFKKLYPNAEIIAFEPDDKVFEALSYNIQSFGLQKVQLIKKALWNEETTLKFYSEGADGGRIANEMDKERIVEIQTERLKNYLNQKVDLLKIDIEGAETIVLEDCKDLLTNVERLFVEYHSFLGQEQKLGRLLQILSQAGFRYQVQHIGVFSPHSFIQINSDNSMDLQMNIFAYRI